MIKKVWGNSKLSGKLAFVFLTLLTIILVLNFFNFRSLKITRKHQQHTGHSFQQLLLLKQLENTIHSQLQESLEIIVRGNQDFKEFEAKKIEVLNVFNEARKFFQTTPEYESGNANQELKTLQSLEEGYSQLMERLEVLIKQPNPAANVVNLAEINGIIEEGFENKFQKFLANTAAKEKQELEEINREAEENYDFEIFLAWTLIGASLGFSLVAYKNLESSGEFVS